jgi:hypothetical protein
MSSITIIFLFLCLICKLVKYSELCFLCFFLFSLLCAPKKAHLMSVADCVCLRVGKFRKTFLRVLLMIR